MGPWETETSHEISDYLAFFKVHEICRFTLGEEKQ